MNKLQNKNTTILSSQMETSTSTFTDRLGSWLGAAKTNVMGWFGANTTSISAQPPVVTTTTNAQQQAGGKTFRRQKKSSKSKHGFQKHNNAKSQRKK